MSHISNSRGQQAQAPSALHLLHRAAATPVSLHQHPQIILMDMLLALAGIADIIVTGIILSMGGREANPVANEILMANGFGGLVTFKVVSFFVILAGIHWVLILEEEKGRRLQLWLLLIWSFPPAFGLSQLALHYLGLL